MSSFGYYEAYGSEYEELLKAQVEIKIDEIWNKIKEPLKGVKDFYDHHQSSFTSSTKDNTVAENLVKKASLDELINVYKNVEKVREGFTGQTINYIVVRSKLLDDPNAEIPYAKLQNYKDWIKDQKGGLQREIGIVTVDDLIIDKVKKGYLKLSPEGIRTAVQEIQSNKVIQELDKRSKKIEWFVQNTGQEYGVFFATVNYNNPKDWNIKDTDSDTDKIKKFNKYYKDKTTYQDLVSAYGFEHDSALQTLYNAGNGGNREEFYYEFRSHGNKLPKYKKDDVCYGIKKSKNELIELPRTDLGRLEEFYLREAARTINEKREVRNNMYVGENSDNVDKSYRDSQDKTPFYQDGDLMVYDYSNGKSVSHIFQVKSDDSGIKISTLCAIIKSIYSVFELYNNNISWRNLKNREQLIRIFIKDKASLKLEELYKELRKDQQEIYNRIDDFISSVLLFN